MRVARQAGLERAAPGFGLPKNSDSASKLVKTFIARALKR
jgi:hypothetical protein